MTRSSNVHLDVSQSGLTPWKLIQTYSPDEWEVFVVEWMEGFGTDYCHVARLAGPGDKGRDVVGYLADPQTDCQWDNYQCKHYDQALMPSQIYTEMGKLCVFTHRADYTVPRKYRFVAPRGVGVKLHDLMRKPEKLKEALIANWAEHCEKKISSGALFPLTGSLKSFVEQFNFGIVWYLTPHEILNQHRTTKYWYQRFKLETPVRPQPESPPHEPQHHELVYLTKLFQAYTDHAKQEVACVDDLKALPKLGKHLRHTRGYFYSAEALNRFSRDHLTPGVFDGIKQHVFDGVSDITLKQHVDGYGCVLAVTEVAAQLQLPQSDITPYVGPADKKGICHHLANDDKLDWV